MVTVQERLDECFVEQQRRDNGILILLYDQTFSVHELGTQKLEEYNRAVMSAYTVLKLCPMLEQTDRQMLAAGIQVLPAPLV